MKFMEIKNVVNVYETPASKIRKYLCLKRERESERENTSRMDMLNLCRQEFPLRKKHTS